MSDTPPPPPPGFSVDPLASFNGWGVTITNGFRTPADTERLKREGYHPAQNSRHLDADAVDLVPGKSGLSMEQLHQRAQHLASQWPGAKVLDEGDHVHVQLPGWGGAPGMPAPPPGFAPAGDNTERKAPIDFHATGQVHDADTIRLRSGQNGRLFGIDAFELNQTGRKPDGSTVPLGQEARDYMHSRLDPGQQVFPTGAETYNRPVVNLTNDPMTDPAHDLLRLGYGEAEPQYLKGSPQFVPYMEAERLARMNHLNGYQTDAVTPPDFRHGGNSPFASPTASPDGKGDAIFADEPMPFQGLRPEIASGYLAVASDPKSSADDLMAFAQANGFVIKRSDAERFIEKRRKAHGNVTQEVTYEHLPRPLIDPGDKAFGSFARGIGDPFNALDELGGVVDTLGLTSGRENLFNAPEGTRFGDILANNIEQNREILAHDEAEHPYARLAGQLTSGVAVPMGAATTPLRLGGIMAAEGGVAGFMGGEGDVKSRLPGTVIGAATGAVAGPVLGLAGEHIVAPLAKRAVGLVGRRSEADAAQAATTGEAGRAGSASMAADRGSELVGPADIPPPPPGFKPIDEPFGKVRDVNERLSPEEMAKLAEGVEPGSVLPRPASEVRTMEEADKANPGNIALLESPDEFDRLGVRTVTTKTGRKVKVRGPLDVTQSLRLMGGVKDTGGDLAHMGITNKPRRMAFGSNEQFLGRIIDNENGLPLDEAAQQLVEEGYLPEGSSTDELLHVLRNEAMGDRHFNPDDLPEVEAFRKTQAQRYAIDQAGVEGSPLADERGHTITLDDLDANTPPASVYEEAPRLTGKIGNINLDRLEKPQDVSALIDQISKRVGGFDAAARGRITHEETRRLAQEMGLKPEQLLKRQQGQALNAEQLYASRALVQRSRESVARLARKAVGGSDEDLATFRKAWLKHVALEDQIAGATAEAGRALAQGRMVAKAQDVGGDAVRSYLKGAGGRENIEDAAQAIVDLMEDPAKASHFMREAVKPRWRDKFNELWINSLLSGPRTHIVNFVGNALTTALSFPELALTAAIGKVSRSPDRALFREVGARAAGLADSSVDALRAMRTAFRTGEPLDDSAKVEAATHQAIGGKLGTIIRTPTRALTAADEFWKSLLTHAELRQIAYRTAQREAKTPEELQARYDALVRAPSDDMVKQAQASARYWTFQRALGPVGRAVQQISNNWILGKIVMPFVRTPSNIIKFAGERSIFAPAMSEVRAALKAGGRARDEALAKITLGSGLSTAAVVAALDGRISGSGPTDPRERAALLQSGWQPNSIKIGDRWVSYARLDPVATLLGVAADFAEAGQWATKREADDIALDLAMGIAKNITSKTWLSGLSDAFDVLSDPDRYGNRYVQRLAGSVAVPAIASQTAQAIDPNFRDARSIMDSIKARIPVISESVPVRRNVWGEPISHGDAVGPDIISPFYGSKQSNDPVNVEVARIRAPLSLPQRSIFVDRKRVELTPKQFSDYVELSGKAAHNYLEDFIQTPAWKAMSDDERREEVKQTLEDFRAAARDELKARHPELGSDASAPPPPPPGFEIAQ